MFRVSTAVYHEYLECVQRRHRYGVLRLHVDPSKHPSTVEILTVYGRSYGTIDAASSHLHLDTNPIRSMPVGRYSRIKLDIDAPNPRDPGQMIQLCKQVCAVVTSLSLCWFPGVIPIGPRPFQIECFFPPKMKVRKKRGSDDPESLHLQDMVYLTWVQVNFRECASRSWRHLGEWNQSLAHHDESWYDEICASTYNGNTDIGLVLQLLEQLRFVRISVLVASKPLRHFYSRSPDLDAVRKLKTRLDNTSLQDPHSMLSRRPEREFFKFSIFDVCSHWDLFYQMESGRRCWNYITKFDRDRLLARIHSLQVWHGYLLDDLPGPSAGFLRHERFCNWCGAYECQHGQALYGTRPLPSPLISSAFGHFWWPGSSMTGACRRMDYDVFQSVKDSFTGRFWVMMSYKDSDKPDGFVVQKSKNERWAEDFCGRPVIKADARVGIRIFADNGWPRYYQERYSALIKCDSCKAEEERNWEVSEQKNVLGILRVLDSGSGLENDQWRPRG